MLGYQENAAHVGKGTPIGSVIVITYHVLRDPTGAPVLRKHYFALAGPRSCKTMQDIHMRYSLNSLKGDYRGIV